MSEFLRVVSVSGGKDSTALYLWAIEQWGKDGFEAVFSDTGHEHPVTYNYVKNLHLMANGPVVQWVRADFSEKLIAKGKAPSGNPFLDMMVWKGRAPSARAQFCTEHLKLDPIRKWLNSIRGERLPIMYVGIRAGESARRSKMPENEFSERFDCLVTRPLLKWTEKDVFDFLAKHDVEPNPLYSSGFTRVGCFPCIHSRKSELAVLPDWAWEKLEQWELAVGQSWFSYGTVPLTDRQKLDLYASTWAKFPPKMQTDAAGEFFDANIDLRAEAEREWKNQNVNSIQDAREWARTSRGGAQFNFFAEDAKDVPSCMSTWGACE